MFGLVRKSKYDELAELQKHTMDLGLASAEAYREARGWMDNLSGQVKAVEKMCEDGGVALDLHDTLQSAVAEFVAGVHAAASEVSEKEKLNQFNRGMLAEREAAKSRHAAA